VIGVDLGFNDADAIAVIGWDEHVRQAYLVKEVVQAQQGITELAESIESLIKEFNPDKVVMDTGGLGKKVAEEIRRRYQLAYSGGRKNAQV
jgi:type II secretory pathway component PulC